MHRKRGSQLNQQSKERPIYCILGMPGSKELHLRFLSRRRPDEREIEYRAELEAVALSQLHCPHAHLKMKHFHSKLADLKVNTCVTCLEGYPGMSVRLASASSAESECLHCARDKHIPKLYSSANNMKPGIVPPELMVRFYTCTFLYVLCIVCLFVLY